MPAVPIVVHRPLATGGRPVVVRSEIAGLAHSDQDVVDFIRRAGLAFGEDVLDDPVWVEWRGGRAHEYGAG
ncbi:hypothetical protein ACFVYF_13960 [Streptomyces sp. NPDC058274]|jgi:hypothetical protein|uniref:hypothetical protein n=1 Tax=Streptomyces sp. NPDC058274 TaxID=3346416 RepID=UPI0036E54E8E